MPAQIESGETDMPDRIYIPNGSMGSVAGSFFVLEHLQLTDSQYAIRAPGTKRSAARRIPAFL